MALSERLAWLYAAGAGPDTEPGVRTQIDDLMSIITKLDLELGG